MMRDEHTHTHTHTHTHICTQTHTNARTHTQLSDSHEIVSHVQRLCRITRQKHYELALAALTICNGTTLTAQQIQGPKTTRIAALP